MESNKNGDTNRYWDNACLIDTKINSGLQYMYFSLLLLT